jgi:hypothetical protein
LIEELHSGSTDGCFGREVLDFKHGYGQFLNKSYGQFTDRKWANNVKEKLDLG